MQGAVWKSQAVFGVSDARALALAKLVIYVGMAVVLLFTPFVGELAESAAWEVTGYGLAGRLRALLGTPGDCRLLALLTGTLASIGAGASLTLHVHEGALHTSCAPIPRRRRFAQFPPPRGAIHDAETTQACQWSHCDGVAAKTPRYRRTWRPGGLLLTGRSPPSRTDVQDHPRSDVSDNVLRGTGSIRATHSHYHQASACVPIRQAGRG